MTLSLVIEVFLCGILPFGSFCLLVSILPLDLSPRLLEEARAMAALTSVVLAGIIYLFGAVAFSIAHWLTRDRVENIPKVGKALTWPLRPLYGKGQDLAGHFGDLLTVLERGKPETFKVLDHGGALSVVLKSIVLYFPVLAGLYVIRLCFTNRPLSHIVWSVAVSLLAWLISLLAHSAYGARQTHRFGEARKFLEREGNN